MTRQACLVDEKVAEKVDVHHRAPLFGVGVGDRLGDQDGGVGDNDVHPAKLLHRAVK